MSNDKEKDYEKFSREVSGLTDQIGRKNGNRAPQGTSHKFKVLTKEVGEIPVGSVVEVFSVNPDQLAFGDLVCSLKNDKPRIGRFLRRSGQEMVIVRQGKPERLASADVLGRVVRAVHNNRDFNPAQQSLLSQLVSRLTDFGTFAFVTARR